jgi:monoamine oxidase
MRNKLDSLSDAGGFSRRDFLKSLSLSLGAIALRPSSTQAQTGPTRFFSREKTDRAKKIIVIGAGLAGLSAAYELSLAGHDVSVLEARNRAGGRVLTLRDFADDLYAEAGGEWVEHNHDYMLRYIEEFGLALYRGSFIDTEEPLNFSPRSREPHEKLQSIIKQIKPFEDKNPSHTEYDRISFYELLKQINAPQAMIDQMQREVSNLMAINIESISALHMLSEFALPESRASFRIAGGNDRVAKSLASRLSEKIYYSRPVVKVEHNTTQVIVTFLENGSQQRMTADRLVIAAPFTCVRRMEFAPSLSEQKMKTIRLLAYGQILKAPLQFRERFWMKAKDEPRRNLKGLIGSVYEATGGQPGPRGLLTAYIPDRSGMEIARLGKDERLKKILAAVTELHPEAGRYFEGGAVKWWQEDEWAEGTYAYFRPGESVSLRARIAEPEGRIHFAGEHTASWQGYMNGAIESGHRAAKEVHVSTK